MPPGQKLYGASTELSFAMEIRGSGMTELHGADD